MASQQIFFPIMLLQKTAMTETTLKKFFFGLKKGEIVALGHMAI